MTEPREVPFHSDGLRLVGYLYAPPGPQSSRARPGVLLLGGFSGMRHVYSHDIAVRLSGAAFWVLSIDQRGFGASEGPRGRVRPLEQVQDAHDALTLLQNVEGVAADRLGVVGVSFGGGNAIWLAATDPRVRCVVSIAGVHDGPRWLSRMRTEEALRELKALVRDAARTRVRSGEIATMPLTDIMIPDSHTRSVFAELSLQDDPLYTPEYDLGTVEALLRWHPEWLAPRIAPRATCIIYGERDQLVLPEEALRCYAACADPKALIPVEKARHYDVYRFVNEDVFDEWTSACTGFLQHHLEP